MLCYVISNLGLCPVSLSIVKLVLSPFFPLFLPGSFNLTHAVAKSGSALQFFGNG